MRRRIQLRLPFMVLWPAVIYCKETWAPENWDMKTAKSSQRMFLRSVLGVLLTVGMRKEAIREQWKQKTGLFEKKSEKNREAGRNTQRGCFLSIYQSSDHGPVGQRGLWRRKGEMVKEFSQVAERILAQTLLRQKKRKRHLWLIMRQNSFIRLNSVREATTEICQKLSQGT